MPAVAIFYGIIIRMYYDDHQPPHFHAEYQGKNGSFNFDGEMIAGNISSTRTLKLVKKWAIQNKAELAMNWKLCLARKPLLKIKPLV